MPKKLRIIVLVFVALGLTSACADHQYKRQIPRVLKYKPARNLPIFLSVRWAARGDAQRAGTPQQIVPGRWVEGVVLSAEITGSSRNKRQVLNLRTKEDPPRKIGLELPLSSTGTLFVERGQDVAFVLYQRDEDLVVSGDSNSMSLIRRRDGSSLHIMHGRTKAPEPFPRELTLILGARRVGRFAQSSRSLCERNYERFSVALWFIGEDKKVQLFPGTKTQWTRDNDDLVIASLRDCRRSSGGSCGDRTEGAWDCQVILEVFSSER